MSTLKAQLDSAKNDLADKTKRLSELQQIHSQLNTTFEKLKSKCVDKH